MVGSTGDAARSPSWPGGRHPWQQLVARARLAALAVTTVLCAGAGAALPTAPPVQDVAACAGAWAPEIAPQGPVLVHVDIDSQCAGVYRNGVRIGRSPVSTGRPGYETPTGEFSVLEKRREHYSNLYDNAPMPFMQRLTWSGVALHAGRLPGYPASHGCIRLPLPFAEALFGVTAPGTPVVITQAAGPPAIVHPAPHPADAARDPGPVLAEPGADVWQWHPQRAPAGPLSVVARSHDREVIVLRGAVEIGRAQIDPGHEIFTGTRAYVLPSNGSPDRLPVMDPASGLASMPWVELQAGPSETIGLPDVKGDLGRWPALPAGFADHLHQLLVPGATLVVTDESLAPRDPEVPPIRPDGGPPASGCAPQASEDAG